MFVHRKLDIKAQTFLSGIISYLKYQQKSTLKINNNINNNITKSKPLFISRSLWTTNLNTHRVAKFRKWDGNPEHPLEKRRTKLIHIWSSNKKEGLPNQSNKSGLKNVDIEKKASDRKEKQIPHFLTFSTLKTLSFHGHRTFFRETTKTALWD